jgi:hypothetical protein
VNVSEFFLNYRKFDANSPPLGAGAGSEDAARLSETNAIRMIEQTLRS